ncbi:MAG TPA: TonB-dependent receptor [Chitinophagaceae bacterium]|nr:TonB-dependent receptor [Chitinophagaceae bacterium]
MLKSPLLLAVTLFGSGACFSQDQASPSDTAQRLSEVIVRAYGQNRQLSQASVAVNVIGPSQLDRFSAASILPALNSTPGVRMEERSPGSYRLNVRGSTLRSPFGVRNIKIYWDGIPLTDPGGNTYLNQLGFYNFQSIEVIKGPGGSLYGAGTGGVMLINSQPSTWSQGLDLHFLGGSYGLNSLNLQGRFGADDRRNIVSYSHQGSEGYRNHTSLRRDVATWQTSLQAGEKQQITASLLYGDMYYQTPGALNLTEYKANPRAARPAAGGFPSADQVQAAIYQKTFLAGVTDRYRISENLSNTTTLYGAFSQIRNPTFRNYERRMEPHFGGRTLFEWQKQLHQAKLQVLFGGEAQKGFFNTKTFQNKNGNPDSLLTDDDINTWTWSAFAQADLRLPRDWDLTAGVSVNRFFTGITRLSVPGFIPVNRRFDNQWAPRLALSKRITRSIWIYGSLSKGFSPPTVQEILPSTSVISTDLQAEEGLDYEAGLKSSWLNQRLYIEINAFHYQLQHAIVQRKDLSNADYFANAGSTRQDGLESQASYRIFQRPDAFFTGGTVWISHTLYRFRYHDFKQGASDYSGNKLPSVAPNTVAAGLDAATRLGAYLSITYFYSDPIALNDANTSYASSYNLVGAKLGWKKSLARKTQLDLFIGVDNLFNVNYSLGNDINAAGGRYYNAAAGVTYYAGLSFHLP